MSSRGSARPTVLVTDASRGSAVAIIRSLGRAGWRVIAGDSEPGSPGFHSRFAEQHMVYPAPSQAPAAFVEAIRAAAERYPIDLVVPVTDAVILPLSRERHRLPASCRLALPEPDQLDIVMDKHKTLALAARLNIPAPRSQVVGVREGAASVDGFGWPVVLKPRFSRVFRDRESIDAFEVSYARDAEDMSARLRALVGDVDVLVQEYYPGVGHGIGLLMHEGRPLAAFQHRRVHEVPITGGPSALRESVPLDREMYAHSVRLLGEIRWTGLAMVEFKVGPAGPRLMEVNGRVWGSLPLAVMSGVDFPKRLGDLYRSGPPTSQGSVDTNYRVGVRARSLTLDLIWIATVLRGLRSVPFLPFPSRWEGLAGLVGLFDPRCRIDMFTFDDPGPWFAELPLLIRRLSRKFAASR